MEETKKTPKAEETKKTEEPKKRKTLAELFNEPAAIAVSRSQMHAAVQIPGAGTESSLHSGRAGQQYLTMVFHPGYGLIVCNKGKYYLTPSANCILAHE